MKSKIFQLIQRMFLVWIILGTGPFVEAQSQDSITFFLLRGIGREAAHWGTTFPDYMRENLPNSQFIMMDLPGAGKYHDRQALASVPKMAAFLRAEYLDQITDNESKKVIVATSLAGNVALEWVNQYPQDFHGAILLSTSLKGVCKSNERVKPEAKKQFVNIFLAEDPKEREEEFLSINSNFNVENDSLLQAWQNVQKERPVKRSALLKQAVAGMMYTPRKSEAHVPVLLVGSKADKIVETECFVNVASAIGSDLYLHQEAGHGIPVDVPKWLADTTSVWVESKVVPYDFSDDDLDDLNGDAEINQNPSGNSKSQMRSFYTVEQKSRAWLKSSLLVASRKWNDLKELVEY